MARVVDSAGSVTCFASWCGYPVSHPDRSANEAYLRDVFSAMGRLMCPAVVMGDLNDHLSSSPVLASCDLLGLSRVSSNEPTTLNKEGEVSLKEPIDHCLINGSARDMDVKVKSDTTLRISDHVPILLSMIVASPRFIQVSWPSPIKLGRKVAHAVWPRECWDFLSWQDQRGDGLGKHMKLRRRET